MTIPWSTLTRTAAVAGTAVLAVRAASAAVTDALGAITAPVLLAALALGAVSTVAGAARWCAVARGMGLVLPLGYATGEVYRATLLNSVLPAGVLGDVHRALSQRSEGDGRGARAVVLERVAGQVVVVVVAVAVLAASPELLVAVFGGWFTGGGLVAVGAVLVALVAGATALRSVRGPSATRIRVALIGAVRTTAADVRAGLGSRRTGPVVVGLSVAAFGGHVALYVLAARVAGVHAPLGRLLPLLVLGLLAMALPLTVGGWGPREAVSAVAFGVVGLGAAQGLAVAVVYGVLSLVSCLPGLLVLLCGHRSRVPRAGIGYRGHPVAQPA